MGIATVAAKLGANGAEYLAGKILGDKAAEYVGKIAHLFGLSSDANPEDIEDYLIKNPDAYLKLKQLDTELRKAEYEDVSDARSMRVKVVQALSRGDWMMNALALLAVALFFYVLYSALTGDVEPVMRDVVMMLVGALTMIVKDVYGFFFGSSKSSADKTNVMAQKM